MMVRQQISRCRNAILLSSVLLCGQAVAETRALLIGVSGYPNLPSEMQLFGPTNDVRGFEAALHRQGVRKISILADGVASSLGNPTHDRILRAFSDEIAAARPGDWLVIYLSGHGSQQPHPAQVASGAKELDALDEIFLPLDAGHWDGSAGSVENALVDDEIGSAITRARRKGISVWAIFDTCHAGDMAKSAGALASPPSTWRRVPPSMLGVPTEKIHKRGARKSHLGSGADERNVAELITFFASQPDEPTSEEMSATGPGGIFTKHLSKLLSEPIPGEASVTFGNLMARIQARYREEGRPFPRPYMEGNAKRRLPFGKVVKFTEESP